ncbi:DUF4065 domain-containing protein [bacterium]|nr:MAG: DUF4065 domain-containing protein [bacterium]
MQIPLTKLKATILFLTNNTNLRYGGKTKLMKLFYFSDFLHVKRYATPITGDQYVNLGKGPIPTLIMNMVGDVLSDPENSELSDTITVETDSNSPMQKIIPNRKFTAEDKKLFSPSEMEILEQVVKKFKDTDTNSIVKASHREAPWLSTNFKDLIPYSLAGRDPDSLYTEEDLKIINSF